MSAGPEEELSDLCAKLKEEGVFVRELDTLGIAYHSPALIPFCDRLHSVLSGVVPHPKQRSKRWLSTCYPLDTEEGGSKTCGPNYHVRPVCNGCPHLWAYLAQHLLHSKLLLG